MAKTMSEAKTISVAKTMSCFSHTHSFNHADSFTHADSFSENQKNISKFQHKNGKTNLFVTQQNTIHNLSAILLTTQSN
jgi:hypothetical protein